MPAFDPVRDAVLNSPLVPTTSAPNSPLGSNPPPFPSPLGSPSLGRRAPHLSILLNSDDHVTPSSASPSSRPDMDKETLPPAVPSLRKSKNLNTEIHDPPQPPQLYHSSTSSVHRSSSTPSSELPLSPPPVALKQVQSLPYRPTHRVTPPGSVMIPLSKSERDSLRTYRGKGTERLSSKKRGRNDDDAEHPPYKKLATDHEQVAAHYNARPEVGIRQRQESPIIGLKNFNNWIKSVLITRFAHPALARPQKGNASGRTPRASGRVLEMGIGKGGDLTKWSKARVKELVGADIAEVSVQQARSRWQTLRGFRFDAQFAAIDCYTEPLSNAFLPEVLQKPFDVVSMQFCMHYAFETEAKVRCMLGNVSNWLRPGGIFIGTIPNAEQLLERLDSLPPDADPPSFGNPVYSIRFEDRKNRPIYGHKYFFFLQDAVDDVPEYIVHWENFVQLCSEYGLKPIYRREFHQVFEEHQSHPDFGPLMVRMKVQNENGESAMDEDQWEAANVYIAFAFEKRS